MMRRKTSIILIATVVLSLFAAAGSVGAVNFEESVASGAKVYADNCASCHGAEGDGGVGPALNKKSKLDAQTLKKLRTLGYIGRETPSAAAGKSKE